MGNSDSVVLPDNLQSLVIRLHPDPDHRDRLSVPERIVQEV